MVLLFQIGLDFALLLVQRRASGLVHIFDLLVTFRFFYELGSNINNKFLLSC